MTSKTINAYVLTSTGKLDSIAAADGSLRPILLGRMDVSMVADGVDLLGSAASVNGWYYDHSNSTVKKYTDAGAPYVRCEYANCVGGGTSWPKIQYNIASGWENRELYVQFYARRDGSIASGCKFVKMYGENPGSDYANTTFNNGYTASGISSIACGDGSGLTNDNTFAVNYIGGLSGPAMRYPSVPENIRPRTFFSGSAWSSAEWGNGTQWHKFQLRAKQNSGTSALDEINDGVYEVWIDGVQRCGAYGLMNRNPVNLPVNQVELASLMQDNLGFVLDIKDVTISLNGWVD